MPAEAAAPYKNPAQRARAVTEAWASSNLYCANCNSARLEALPANTPAKDFRCPACGNSFQLKGQAHAFGRRIVDAAYGAMMAAIERDETPNLFALHYTNPGWRVENLFLVPSFVFSPSAVEKRKPLKQTARRSEWVGCYILLERIPPEARIPLVLCGVVSSPAAVRRNYSRLKPLSKIESSERGWTLDVLTGIRSFGKSEFTLPEAYSLESRLSALHPANRHVRPKIRQQLQELRDAGLVEFLGGGRYRLL
jgi:type II restriction enzyme